MIARNNTGIAATMQKLIGMILIFAYVFTAGCTSLRFPGVFRIDIPQGNIISAANVEQLKVGMTSRQVEYLMGTAMIQDPFHPDRKDYFYHLETGKGKLLQNRITLYFDRDTLVKIDKGHYSQKPELQSDVDARLKAEADLKRRPKIFTAPEDSIPPANDVPADGVPAE
ncbi:probable outer membrane lipoprotein OmlA [gamma proteobacterium HdN1]|nr:probable outer membrane lipoprotein OmlA [gamma proteobacterium HdN1]